MCAIPFAKDAMELLHDAAKLLLPLVIIMDPLGNLTFFLLFTQDQDDPTRRRTALIAAAGAGAILLLFSFSGEALLQFFAIGLPAFQLSGGLILLIHALQMLHLIPQGIKTTSEEQEEGIAKENVGLVPLATPLLAGPGAVTAVLVWRQQAAEFHDLVLLNGAIIAACILTYLVFASARRLRELLGVGGIRVATRLMGLLLAVIAVQFMVNGVQALR
ncbi:membrane protein [Methylogaea oryzae]|uniref:UPF0056 membrane protein n=2 Tax=Methylogaea oryzae TaxID=1295382 RepID=A0A8D4VRP3_9GAMM|nr:membrane protein [Methylogaea oryzae]